MNMSTKNSLFFSKGSRSRQDLKQALLTLLIFALILLILATACYCLFVYAMNKSMECPKFPASGIFYCEELGATLCVEDASNVFLQLKDGTVQDITLSRSGNMYSSSLTQVFVFQASYEWNEEKNWVTLKIEEFPEPFQENKKYVFKGQE